MRTVRACRIARCSHVAAAPVARGRDHTISASELQPASYARDCFWPCPTRRTSARISTRLDKSWFAHYITIVTLNQLTNVMKRDWILLIYKIPSHPTRLRARVWRQLQRCGAIYLQNSVSIVPATSELAENMQWIADEIREMGGEALVFRATATSAKKEDQIERLFSGASRAEAGKLLEALRGVEGRLRPSAAPRVLAEAEDELRRIRQAALKLRLRSHFPVAEEEALHKRLRAARDRVDRHALRAARRR